MVEKYRVGKAGWLFLDNDANNVFSHIQGIPNSIEQLVDGWFELNATRQSIALESGFDFRTYVVPNKHCVYRKFLPDDVKVSEERIISRLLKKDPENLFYDIEIFDTELATFHKTDTHWNDYGAYLQFLKIVDDFGIEGVQQYAAEDFLIKSFVGDLKPVSVVENSPFSPFSIDDKLVFFNGVVNVGGVYIWENDDFLIDDEFVCFGGSSVIQIAKYFVKNFRRFIFVWTQAVDWDLVRRLGVKNVLSMPRERYMTGVADDDLKFEYKQIGSLKYLSKTQFSEVDVKISSDYMDLVIGEREACRVLAEAAFTDFSLISKKSEVYNKFLKISKENIITILVIGVSRGNIDYNFFSVLKVFFSLFHDGQLTLSEISPLVATLLDVDQIRDAAIKLEKTDISSALYLMNIAHNLRPNGPFIKRKIQEYRTAMGDF